MRCQSDELPSPPREELPPLPPKAPSLLMDPKEHTVSPQCTGSADAGGLLPGDVRDGLEDNVQNVPMEETVKVKRPRTEVSLGILTQKFMDLIRSAPEGVLDLNKVAETLGVSKRRVYDITNILDGINLVEKKSKNHIRWIGCSFSGAEAKSQQKKLQEEVSDLSAMEDALDELIKDCAQQLFELTDDKENKRLAYVTYQDISKIPAFHKQNIIAVKSPAETVLDIPTPGEDSIALHLRSTEGPIDVYLCQVEKDHSNNEMSEGTEATSSESKYPEHFDKEENSPQPSKELPKADN
ncbi:Transcription factor E2F6 [Galemys pyrenaicus]|uniref:Transcription factor E2F6 n=1 Tax=Galemys pyrenaicus TaxID=202257 RepID=A0A8J6A5N6_GALPY|nr:Transcription factor E2F6 [Galemys pyrenaicus]